MGVCGRIAGHFPECGCKTRESRFGALGFWWCTTKELSKILHHWKIVQRLRFVFKLRHKIKPRVHGQENQCSLVNRRKVHCGTRCRPGSIWQAKSMFVLHPSAFFWRWRRESRIIFLIVLFCIKVFLSLFPSPPLDLSSPTASHHIVTTTFCCTQCYRIHRELCSSARIHKENIKYHRLTWLGAPCGKWEETIDEIYNHLPNLDTNSLCKQQGIEHPNLWDKFCQSQPILSML